MGVALNMKRCTVEWCGSFPTHLVDFRLHPKDTPEAVLYCKAHALLKLDQLADLFTNMRPIQKTESEDVEAALWA